MAVTVGRGEENLSLLLSLSGSVNDSSRRPNSTELSNKKYWNLAWSCGGVGEVDGRGE